MSFDRIAPYYRWMELILAGGKLHRCRTAFLGQIPTPKNILLLGEGHGCNLVEYRRRFAEAKIACVDASAGMLAQARQSLVRNNLKVNGVEFIHDDVLNWVPPPSRYDLVVTNFFLDCFRPDQLELILSKVAACSTPDANWLLADFKMPPSGWRRARSGIILWLLYAFFRAVTRLPARKLTRPDLILLKHGFVLRDRIDIEWGMLHSDWWRQENPTTLSP
jgi:ubiquinone/menaquinone biosynthesis C-methylase UbiE